MPINNDLIFTEAPENAELNERLGKFRRNGEWLTQYGTSLFEQYAGQHIAVSEGDVLVAADASQARQMAQEKHPEDEPFVQYVPTQDLNACCIRYGGHGRRAICTIRSDREDGANLCVLKVVGISWP